jgi:hypothetical protein
MNPANKQLKTERKQRVDKSVVLYNQGLPIPKIADKLDVAKSTIVGYLLEQGIDLNKKPEIKKTTIIKKSIKKPQCPNSNMLLMLIIIICLLIVLATF